MDWYPKQRFGSFGRLGGTATATSVAEGDDPVTQGRFPLIGAYFPGSWNECQLATDTTSVSKSRKFASDRLDRWNLGQDVRDDVVLVVSELVTNAIVHTASDEIIFHLGISEDIVYVAISDQGRDPDGPQVRAASLAESGRGLQLVSALAEEWGVIHSDGKGRIVWAVFRETRPQGLV